MLRFFTQRKGLTKVVLWCFIGILVLAYLWSRSADPQIIDVDPVAVDAQRHPAR